MKLNCIIIDDESLARKYLKDYVSKVPFLEFSGEFNSPLKAMEIISSGNIDLIFLDIEMPEITGIDFLKSQQHIPQVILTTAYREYALDGYELNITDYLLKPFSFDRFLKAVNKANLLHQTKNSQIKSKSEEYNQADFHVDYLIIHANKKYYKVNYSDLIYMEGQKAYVTFYTGRNGKITALASLRELEEKLPIKKFIRIHKSYIVSVDHMDSLEGNQLSVSGEKLPVGKNYKINVSKIFNID